MTVDEPQIPRGNEELTLSLTLTVEEWGLTAAALGVSVEMALVANLKAGGMSPENARTVQVADKARDLIIRQVLAVLKEGEHGQ